MLSTPSKANSQRGLEAESRFRFEAKAKTSTSAQSGCDVEPVVDKKVAVLYERGQVCPHAHFFNGEPKEYENLCQEYSILGDMVVSQVAAAKLRIEPSIGLSISPFL
ncbi:hypothetical protein RHMOL_Rhmol09G0091500 [Rhododendron molle]|uniref:Uncharacterized protein n=1 Tax=Rhododendron molle TaxID=49168 RepID=A0ACC0MCJ6_RHOML|nr:hypothetical protein RHMOL_Rhmol09G0091500 [Rhododendron molle]